jgi:AcrR family transcriptional regulator
MSSVSSSDATRRRSGSAAARRRLRAQEIIDATRQLFDERGMRDAQIDDIASAVGINRAIVYRHFTGKEELFALTLVQYLDELREVLREAADAPGGPEKRLEALVGAFVDYGLAHPAFVDCAQAMMRRPGDDLLAEVSEDAMFRLGRAMTGCMAVLTEVIEQGCATGHFDVEDPYLLANMLYASGLGTLQLGRVQILVTEDSPGVPRISRISHEQVREHVISSALANTIGSRQRVR